MGYPMEAQKNVACSLTLSAHKHSHGVTCWSSYQHLTIFFGIATLRLYGHGLSSVLRALRIPAM